MAHIPPSVPHLLWLARPRAVCHANGVSHENGPDTGTPGKTDDTFHYTLNNCRSSSVKLLQRRGVRGKTQQVRARVKSGLVAILQFLSPLCTLPQLPPLLPLSSFGVCVMADADQAQPVHCWLKKSAHIKVGCVLG